MLAIFMVLFTLFSPSLCAAAGQNDCLECHDTFTKFNHAKTGCIDCHKDAASLPHQEKLKKPLCIECHKKASALYGQSIHSAGNLSCKDCHTVHSLDTGTKECLLCHKGVAHSSLPSKKKHITNLGCTICHVKAKKGSITAEFRVHVSKGDKIGKETIDPDANNFIDEAELDRFLAYLKKDRTGSYSTVKSYVSTGDVHSIAKKAIQCSECHGDKNIFGEDRFRLSGVSSYAFRADPRIFIPESPSVKEYKTTVHGKQGVACSDCHVSQERISDSVCVKCHEEVYGTYKNSVHAKKGAAQCTDCHNPHSIIAYREYNAKQRLEVCARCHKDYPEKHAWLPHTRLHFNYLECSTCHSPESKKSIVFNLGKRTGDARQILSYQDIRDVYGGRVDLKSFIDLNGDGVVTSEELSDFFLDLRRKFREDLFIGGSIIVTKVHHDYSAKGTKRKICTTCHSQHAPFYDSMYLILPAKEKHLYIPVKGTILGAAPISVFTDLNLLGEERVTVNDVKGLFGLRDKARPGHIQELGFKWIDILGIAVCAAILIFILFHIIARIFLKR
ncbi:MAG: hypothetical protein A4E64_00495 [Syntrophorhabdus sp. PtaU1.Bin058]|nr:MAG: hypothetical protein A4E64_00495 [Syntrophorhabdus sp. PtaU1.Bin058]